MSEQDLKTKFDSTHSLYALQHLLDSYYQGKFLNAYIMIAGELRKLLCDRKQTLLPRAMPNIRLMRIDVADKDFPEGTRMYISPCEVISYDGMVDAALRLSKKWEVMNVEDWVNQPLFNPRITIFEFVKSIADKMDAHSDENPNETLRELSFGMLSNIPPYVPEVIGLAKHVLECVDCYEKKKDPVEFFKSLPSLDKRHVKFVPDSELREVEWICTLNNFHLTGYPDEPPPEIRFSGFSLTNDVEKVRHWSANGQLLGLFGGYWQRDLVNGFFYGRGKDMDFKKTVHAWAKRELATDTERFEYLLNFIHRLMSLLWLYQDNSVNVGFFFFLGTSGFKTATHEKKRFFTKANGQFEDTEFDGAVIDWVFRTQNDVFFLLAQDKMETSRFSRALILVRSARENADVREKVSSYLALLNALFRLTESESDDTVQQRALKFARYEPAPAAGVQGMIEKSRHIQQSFLKGSNFTDNQVLVETSIALDRFVRDIILKIVLARQSIFANPDNSKEELEKFFDNM